MKIVKIPKKWHKDDDYQNIVVKAIPLKNTNIGLLKNDNTKFRIAFSLSVDFSCFLVFSP